VNEENTIPSRANAGYGFDTIGARRTCTVMVRGWRTRYPSNTNDKMKVCRCVGDPTPKDMNAQSAGQRLIRWHVHLDCDHLLCD
jgi:hypothetical protein